MDPLEKRLFLSQSGLEILDVRESSDIDNELRELVEATCAGSWRTVLQNEKFSCRIVSCPDGSDQPDLARLCVAVACLYEFLSSNWTLPSTDAEEDDVKKQHDENLGKLDLASQILDSLRSSSLVTLPWWTLRANSARVAVTTDIPREDLEFYLQQLSALETQVSDFSSQLGAPHADPLLLLEISTMYHRLNHASKSRDLLTRAREKIGLNFWLDGRMGRRTKYQVDAKAQLVLNVEGGDQKASEVNGESSSSHLPADCLLDDDLLLSKTALEGDPVVTKTLTAIEQVIVLSESLNMEASEARDELLDEKMKPFLDAVLLTPRVWCVQYTALFVRSKVEMKKTRKMERAMLQLQSLVDGSTKSGKKHGEGGKFCEFFFALPVPKFRRVSHLLADAYLNLGMFKTALEIFERLGMWKDVIMCHVTVGNSHVAEEIARDLLAKDENSPQNWCLLGHATGNMDHYEKAWEVSDSKCAEAKKCIGNILFQRKKYVECLPHYRDAVRLSSTDFKTWYRLAYAALKTEEWTEGARAYRHCLNLETDSFECWNNLARCHMELDDKEKAWRCLNECTRFAYDDKNVWENFLVISFQTGRVREVIRSANRMLDLKKKIADVAMLETVVDLVVSGDKGLVAATGYNVRKDAVNLAARLAAECPQEPKFHIFLGRLLLDPTQEGTPDEQTLQRGVQSLIRGLGQVKREETAKSSVLSTNVAVARQVLENLFRLTDTTTAKRFATSCRLNAQSVATWASTNIENNDDGVKELIAELRKSVGELGAFCSS